MDGEEGIAEDSGGGGGGDMEPARRCGLLSVCVHRAAISIAGASTLIAVSLSLKLMRDHLKHNELPEMRRCTIRILAMVPIYSVQSCLALLLVAKKDVAALMKVGREVYEAFVIVSFMQFIIVCAGGSQNVLRRFDSEEMPSDSEGAGTEPPSFHFSHTPGGGLRVIHHIAPFSWCLPPFPSARAMLHTCVLGTFLYVVVAFVEFVVDFGLIIFPRYRGMLSPLEKEQVHRFPVGAVVMCLSQGIAMTSLFTLSHNLLDVLQPLQPVRKFLAVKFVIFFSFWQSLVLRILVHYDKYKSLLDERELFQSQEQIAELNQSFLICIEMCIVSIWHMYTFLPSDGAVVLRYLSAQGAKVEFRRRSRSTIAAKTLEAADLSDIGNLTTEALRHAWRQLMRICSSSCRRCSAAADESASSSGTEDDLSSPDGWQVAAAGAGSTESPKSDVAGRGSPNSPSRD